MKLCDEIDAAYLESLQADQENSVCSNFLSDSEGEIEELEQLKSQRKQRVMDEPDLSDPHCAVTVRHTSLGNKSRIFSASCTFVQVYNWVGSLSLRQNVLSF